MAKVSVIPMRAQANDRSEMVSQLLFGECVEVVRSQGKNWRKVVSIHDNYVGWVDPKQLYFLEDNELDNYKTCDNHSLELTHSIYSSEKAIPIVLGSEIHRFDGITSKLPFGKFTFNGQTLQIQSEYNRQNMIVQLAKKYLHAPYLWGGRSPFGIDCSGFTQVVFKIIGVNLPRDANQQINHGEIVDFVNLAQPGDLAFFENAEGVIHHVGILLEDQKIIHASGCVRIDYVDHQGIFRQKRRAYTHKLRMIKRLL